MSERLFTAIDLATLAYVGLATVAVLLPLQGEDIPGWPWLLAAHILLVTLVVLPPRACAAGPVGRFLGDWYPMPLRATLYGKIGVRTLDAGSRTICLLAARGLRGRFAGLLLLDPRAAGPFCHAPGASNDRLRPAARGEPCGS